MSTMSIIVPCHNEESTIELFYSAMLQLTEELSNVSFEYIFIDDGSTDKTYPIIEDLHKKNPSVKCISFSRNFGKEAAIFAGLHATKGDCCVVMDADLQHPPASIPEMYHLWEEGYDIVEGIKSTRGKESAIHGCFAKLFYSLMSKLMGIDMTDSSDFKLLDRKVINTMCQLQERNTFFRALSFWVGYKTVSITYDVQERVAGTSKWSPSSLITYALRNLVSFSYTPLYFISIFGFIILFIGVIFGIDAFITYTHGISTDGYPSIIILLTLSTGGIMLSLGIVGIYIAKIYDEIKKRPQYIIRNYLE